MRKKRANFAVARSRLYIGGALLLFCAAPASSQVYTYCDRFGSDFSCRSTAPRPDPNQQILDSAAELNRFVDDMRQRKEERKRAELLQRQAEAARALEQQRLAEQRAQQAQEIGKEDGRRILSQNIAHYVLRGQCDDARNLALMAGDLDRAEQVVRICKPSPVVNTPAKSPPEIGQVIQKDAIAISQHTVHQSGKDPIPGFNEMSQPSPPKAVQAAHEISSFGASIGGQVRLASSAEDQFKLGVMFANGQGVSRNEDEAAKLYRLAADSGYAPAQQALGTAYLYGKGVPKSSAEAARYYQLAAIQGDKSAQSTLGAMYGTGQGVTKNFTESFRWLKASAEQGDSIAQYNLSILYKNGQGIAKNEFEVLRLYRISSENGYAPAQNALGGRYKEGIGIQRDYAKAAWLYRQAADQGFAAAQYNLGWMYQNGKGVSQSDAEALRLYRLAAAQGLEAAKIAYSALLKK